MKCVLVISLSLANCFLVTSYTLVSSGQSGEKHNAVRADASRQATAKLTPSQVFSIANPSVVMIVASSQNDKEQALGSGFIVNQNRVVTNHHVVEGMSQAYVLFSDGKVQPVSEVISDSVEQDLIVLGVETGQRRQLLLGDELSLREGDAVYAIGAPKGLELSFTNGIVSSFRKSGSQFLIQTTAPIAPGSSGGPLLDGSGQVVGVTTARITDAPGIYFSVGIGDVKRLLRTPFGATLGLKEWADQQKTESGVSVPSHSEKGEDGKPSLEATFGWMTDFSMRHGKYTNKEEQHSNYLQQERGCEAKITHSVTSRNSSWNEVDTFRLGDIDPQHIIVTVTDSAVNFFTLKNYKLIHRTQPSSETKSRVFDLYSDYLSFDSKDSADRFAAALKHAVTLCVSAEEPF